MSNIFKDAWDGLTGAGAIKDAQRDTRAATQQARADTKEGVEQAREDINRMFPQAQQTAQQGFQGALDIFGQSLPAQADVFQQGNVGAQQAILSGLPQIQNAILGGAIDYSNLKPFEVQTPSLGFFQQTLPQTRQAELDAKRQALNSNPFLARLNGYTPENENTYQGPGVMFTDPFNIGKPVEPSNKPYMGLNMWGDSPSRNPWSIV